MIDERIARGMERQRELRRGRPIGWKLGFGAPASLERLSLDGPLAGFLEAERVLEPGAEVSLEGWASPVLEAEMAAHIARDIPSRAGRATVRDSLAGLGMAIELADLHPPPDDVEEILAGNVYHRHVIFGPMTPGRRSADGVTGRVLNHGDEVARTDAPEELNGELIGVLAHVATMLGACGEALRAGDVVITGSVVPPMPVAPGDDVVAELPPLGSLAVRFLP